MHRSSVSESALKASPSPTKAESRLERVDILRGFAIFGILLVNMISLSGNSRSPTFDSGRLDFYTVAAIRFFAEAKFYSLFSFLFGWGMTVQMSRSAGTGMPRSTLLIRRLSFLLVIGLIHGIFIWDGDILTLYAVLGFGLLLLHRSSRRTLLMLTGLALLSTILLNLPGEGMDTFRQGYDLATSPLRLNRYSPTSYGSGSYLDILPLRIQEFISLNSWLLYFVGPIFGMFTLGMWAGKIRFFTDFTRKRPCFYQSAWFFLVVGLVFNAIFVWAALWPWTIETKYQALFRVGARTIGAPSLMLFYVIALCLLYERQSWRSFLSPLKFVGRSALSNYILQSIFGTFLFYGYGLGLYGEISLFAGLVLSVVIFLFQIRLSQRWFERFQFGPLEWIWRSLTYSRLQPVQAHGDDEVVAFLEFLRRVRSKFRRIPARLRIAVAWLLILFWAAFLWQWNKQLDAARMLLPAASTSHAAPVQANVSPSTERVSQAPESGLVAAYPVDYDPGPLARAGDTLIFANGFDSQLAFNHIETLTAPDFEGRYAGSPGGWLAADYIALQFEKYRLQPAGPEGSFFQPFSLSMQQLAGVPRLNLWDPDTRLGQAYVPHRDFSPVVSGYQGSGDASGEVIWVDDCELDDYDGLNVVGNIIFCFPSPGNRALISAGRYAMEHGADGLLLYTDPQIRPPDFGYILRNPWVPSPLPGFRVYPGLAASLIRETGMSLEDLIDEGSSRPLGVHAMMRLDLQGDDRCAITGCWARNVLGVLPGRDPEVAQEVVVIGAHYDHLGSAPDGTVWPGANDNASGVSVMLEIARLWADQGYVPRRTVLFAAWDAEEHGLLGSEYYVEHPSYLLEKTVAVINLDMVGAGAKILSVSGESNLARRIARVADTLGVNSELGNLDRSDHRSFLAAGVPAALLIWFDGNLPREHYHRPADTSDVINMELLTQSGQIAAVTLIDIAESEPAILELIDRREEALITSNRAAFFGTSTSTQTATDAAWLESFESIKPTGWSIAIQDLEVFANTARARIRYTFQDQDPTDRSRESQVSESLTVRFENGPSGWRWAGPDLMPFSVNAPSDEVVQLNGTVWHPPDVEDDWGQIIAVTADRYQEVSSLLGLTGQFADNILLFPDGQSLRAGTSLAMPVSQTAWVGPNEIRLVYQNDIGTSVELMDSLVHLVMANTGLRESAAPWLWHGLPWAIRNERDEAYTQAALLPPLTAILLEGEPIAHEEATAWAAVSYLKEQAGWDGLGRLIQQLGAACQEGNCEDPASIDRELIAVTGMDGKEFEAAWQRAWHTRLQSVQSGLNELMAVRSEAVLAKNPSLFVSTADPHDPQRVAAERHWIEALAGTEIEKYSLEASPLALFSGGDVLAQVNTTYRLIDSGSGPIDGSFESQIFLTSSSQGYLWAGPFMETTDSEGITVRYPAEAGELATEILQTAMSFRDHLSRRLELPQVPPMQIELYSDRDGFQRSIALNFPQFNSENGWSAPGEAVKLYIGAQDSLEEVNSTLAIQMVRRLLYDYGLNHEWLLKGGSLYLASFLDKGVIWKSTASSYEGFFEEGVPIVPDSLVQLQPDHVLNPADISRSQWLAWDSMRYFVERFGWGTLRDLLIHPTQKRSLEESFLAETKMTLLQFESDWQAALALGHIHADWVQMATRFNEAEALNHVTALTAPPLSGRRAGTLGADLAANYLAQQFASLNLLPLGDLEGEGYFQTFPITDTRLTQPPIVNLISGASQQSESLIFREDFIGANSPLTNPGTVEGPMVLVQNTQARGQILEGSIAVLLAPGNLDSALAWATEQELAALLLVGEQDDDRVFPGKLIDGPYNSRTGAIPALELTADGFTRILQHLKIGRRNLPELPPISETNMAAEVAYYIDEPMLFESVNVIGLLPGSDAELANEFLVVGAHYDHVGHDPDVTICRNQTVNETASTCHPEQGMQFSGTNDNSSGVGVLLEILRNWRAHGYQPKRSLLIVGWGAQELGELGSRYFLTHPTIPADNIIGMVQLDGVGGGEGRSLRGQGRWTTDGRFLFSLQAAQQLLQDRLILIESIGQSDHLPFLEAGFPTLLVTWSLANEANLPDELADPIHPERVAITGRMVTLALMAIAQ